MIQTSLMRDTFEYFAKYPLLAGVTQLFNQVQSDYFQTEYEAFRTKIEGLAVNSLIPDITDYIFGVDEELVKQRINEVNKYFLFIDYGSITTEESTTAKTRTDTLLLGVTVATPIKRKSFDLVEATLFADQALDFIRQIREQMRMDLKCNPLLQRMTFPNEITPFYARELYDATGWSMLFSLSGPEML